MKRPCPRLVIAALRGSAGKTTLTVALAAALRRRQSRVIPFKKGPDYIDAAWLALASAHPCHNLDTFMMGRDECVSSFSHHALPQSISLIEGNRGLYDGLNPEGEHSTAELAKLLGAPVIMVVDCDKVTRTTAAMIVGCRFFDPGADIRGVILNRVGGSRHANIVRRSIELNCGIPVLGVVPRMAEALFSERHLGLIPPQEQDMVRSILERLGDIAAECLDLEKIVETAGSAPEWEHEAPQSEGPRDAGVTIGVVRDTAFQFYYPENIQALADQGARVLEISALADRALPKIDALYIGGGFPETQAERLSANESFRRSVREAARSGLPIYAECGGFMYLGEKLVWGEKEYPMAGALPVVFGMEKRPQGHGYTELDVAGENPFFATGTRIRGHEFHYSRVLSWDIGPERLVFKLKRGTGTGNKKDGVCFGNILAGYTHLHALGTPQWAAGMVRAARNYSESARPLYGGSHPQQEFTATVLK